jgi:hypothetical protein
MADPIAQSIATVNPAGSQPFVQVYDSPNNFGVFTLSLHDGASGATLSVLASNANSDDTPDVRYVIPLLASQTAGKILVCRVTLVPAGTAGPLGFTLNVVQDDKIIDDGKAALSIASNQPENGAIRVVLQ